MYKQTGTANDMALKDNLKRARQAAGLSQAGLAKLSGVSQQSVSRLEKGDDQTTKFLPKLARALGVSPSDLDPEFAESQEAQDEFVRMMLEVPPASRPLFEEMARQIVSAREGQKAPSSSPGQPPAKRK